MIFDPENKIVQLCAEGMQREGEGEPEAAFALFTRAWQKAGNDFEKFTAAHYVARHQKNTSDKLHWDQTALSFALKLKDRAYKETYPSLYLNIANCYEDLKDYENAKINYQQALSYAVWLPQDGYGSMIRSGIQQGIKRVSKISS